MKKIENRAVVCLLLALVLAVGMVVFLFRYLTQGGSWASSPFNRHLYNAQGQLTAGTRKTGSGPTMTAKLSARPPFMPWATFRATLAPGR